MKITGLESPVLKRSIECDGPPPDLPWHMAWRRVLEEAQWEARARYQPTAETTALAVSRDSPSSAATVSNFKVDIVQMDGTHETAILRLQSEAALSRPSHRFVNLSALPTRGDTTNFAHAGPGLARTAASMRAIAASAPMTRLPMFALGEWAQWLPRAMHLNVQGQQVRASVRDEQLDAAQTQQLFFKMRKELQSWGFELIELIVNGHPAQSEQAYASQHKDRNHGS